MKILKNLAGFFYSVLISDTISGLLIFLIKLAAQVLLLKAAQCMK